MSIQSDLDAAANQQPQPTAAGERCRCDQEEGDSRCPGHPTCEECSEPAGPNYLCADHGTAAGEPIAETKVPHVHEWTTFVRNSDMQWCSCGAEKPYGRDRIMVPEARMTAELAGGKESYFVCDGDHNPETVQAVCVNCGLQYKQVWGDGGWTFVTRMPSYVNCDVTESHAELAALREALEALVAELLDTRDYHGYVYKNVPTNHYGAAEFIANEITAILHPGEAGA